MIYDYQCIWIYSILLHSSIQQSLDHTDTFALLFASSFSGIIYSILRKNIQLVVMRQSIRVGHLLKAPIRWVIDAAISAMLKYSMPIDDDDDVLPFTAN